MGFGDILGQIMQQGLGGQGQPNARVQNTARNLGAEGGGLEAILGQLQGALGRSGVDTGSLQRTAEGFSERAQDFLRKDQIGNLSGAKIGGIGAIAGALLGGGLGGAARGGAMAVLGTLALTALRNAQAARAGSAADQTAIDPADVEAVARPDSERLMLAAMISAAKADGTIDQAEMQKIIGKLGEVTADEKQFVLEQMAAPLDIGALAAQVTGGRAQAAEVYAASLLAVDSDTEQEKAYLRELAKALGLDDGTVAQLHAMTGATA
jgi:uncharacterized membrane protein YebE (DUF533 family)